MWGQGLTSLLARSAVRGIGICLIYDLQVLSTWRHDLFSLLPVHFVVMLRVQFLSLRHAWRCTSCGRYDKDWNVFHTYYSVLSTLFFTSYIFFKFSLHENYATTIFTLLMQMPSSVLIQHLVSPWVLLKYWMLNLHLLRNLWKSWWDNSTQERWGLSAFLTLIIYF